MTFEDHSTVRLGDWVALSDGIVGEVVCSLDTREFSEEFREKDWGYLGVGILVRSSEAGIVHYQSQSSISVARAGGRQVER